MHTACFAPASSGLLAVCQLPSAFEWFPLPKASLGPRCCFLAAVKRCSSTDGLRSHMHACWLLCCLHACLHELRHGSVDTEALSCRVVVGMFLKVYTEVQDMAMLLACGLRALDLKAWESSKLLGVVSCQHAFGGGAWLAGVAAGARCAVCCGCHATGTHLLLSSQRGLQGSVRLLMRHALVGTDGMGPSAVCPWRAPQVAAR